MALIVGIDLGRKSAHDVVTIRRETSRQLGGTFRFSSTPKGIDHLFEKIEKVRDEDEPLEFVIDSPGKAWIPVAAAIRAKGFKVYRPTADQMSKMRRAGNRKNKTNRIDAMALARCRLNFPDEVQQVFLPKGVLAQLDQLVRQRDRLVDSIRRRKQRIQDMCESINPGLIPAMGSFALTEAGRAFLRTYLIPQKALRAGFKRLSSFLQNHYRLKLDPKKAEAIFSSCQDALKLYEPVREAKQMPFDEGLLQEEMIWELDQLEREEKHLALLEKKIEQFYQKLDPNHCLISLPGIRFILAAGITSCVGDIDRFHSLTKHRGYAGFYPLAKGTGDKRSSGTPISKMSSNRYKRYLYLAAENAYKWDLELAAFYHKCRQAGHTHTQAVCAVGNGKLLPRIHHMMKQIKLAQDSPLPAPHYVFKDLSGNPISKVEAKAIITAKWGDVSYS